MLYAYASSVVILTLGLVVLTITLAVLSFQNPEKANAFLMLLAGPMVVVLFSHLVGLVRAIKNGGH
jgi:O-antigen/teichoic acid export membrane protein